MLWCDFGPIRTSGSIVSNLTLHSLTGTMKGPGSFETLPNHSLTYSLKPAHVFVPGLADGWGFQLENKRTAQSGLQQTHLRLLKQGNGSQNTPTTNQSFLFTCHVLKSSPLMFSPCSQKGARCFGLPHCISPALLCQGWPQGVIFYLFIFYSHIFHLVFTIFSSF